MITLRSMTADDSQAVLDIYAQGIATGLATFETQVPSWQLWDAKFLPEPRLIAEIDGAIGGWAVLSAISKRDCYRGVAEVTVYVGDNARGRGLGTALLNALITTSEEHGFWMLQGVIFRDNETSVRLHEKCGFRVVGYRERIAQLRGKWLDTVLMERRSPTIGTSDDTP